MLPLGVPGICHEIFRLVAEVKRITGEDIISGTSVSVELIEKALITPPMLFIACTAN